MRTFIALLAALLLTGCITVETKTPPPPLFVTSTLPALPTAIPTQTATPVAVPTLPRPANCKDAAVLMQDVTIPDGTRFQPGETFTKTWRLRNTGTCPWDRNYQLVFVSGERMGAPDFVPVPVTGTQEDADISVGLAAPSANGTYTGIYELRNGEEQPVPIGIGKTVWVKIVVGNGAPAVAPTVAASGGTTPIAAAANCTVSENGGYVSQLLSLINAARREAGGAALSVNPQLTVAAQGHSTDMACNNFLGHMGSDGSEMGTRLLAAGYVWSGFLEIIAIGTPQDAMYQWKNDAEHWDAVIASGVTEIGIGYAYNANSDYQGYFTVDLGAR
jgi:uncharacterized protein YkwD